MSVPQPFLSGKDAKLRLYLDDGQGKLSEVVLTAKTWSVKTNSTKYVDDVDGEDRGRPGNILNFYDLTANCYTSDGATLDAWLLNQANADSQSIPLEVAARMRLKVIGGKAKNYIASELVLDDFDLTQGGRAERLMGNVTMRFRYFKKTTSV
jgi:hypothetical protein